MGSCCLSVYSTHTHPHIYTLRSGFTSVSKHILWCLCDSRSSTGEIRCLSFIFSGSDYLLLVQIYNMQCASEIWSCVLISQLPWCVLWWPGMAKVACLQNVCLSLVLLSSPDTAHGTDLQHPTPQRQWPSHMPSVPPTQLQSV